MPWQRPELWENVVRLAADELIVHGRHEECWRLLVDLCRPYLREGRSPQSAMLALEIAGRREIFAVEVDEFDPRAHSLSILRRTALAGLTDVERVTPELRNAAGELLGRQPGGMPALASGCGPMVYQTSTGWRFLLLANRGSRSSSTRKRSGAQS